MQAFRLARSPIAQRALTQSIRRLATNPPPPPPQTPPKDDPSSPPPPVETPPQPSASTSLPSLDFSPSVEEEMRKERTGARSSKDSLSSIERRRRYLVRSTLALLLLGVGVEGWLMGREWEEWELKEKKMRLEDAPATRWGRTKMRFGSFFGIFTEPLWSELLPPQHPALGQKRYTLLISIDDLLVTSTWDRQHGWRTAKRPGVDYFLAYLSHFYEIVIFSTQYNYTGEPIIAKLDPYQLYIQYRLYRDACRSVNGQPVKDLSYLNRDLSKVILLDTHPEHVTPQPENAVIIPKWKGDPKDKGLIAMIPFLESIGIFNPPDVRPILQAYHGKDIPLEYAKKESEMKRKHIEEWEQNRKGALSSSFTFSSLFGGSSRSDASPVPPTYLEQKRREAQKHYEEERAWVLANREKFDALIKEEQDKMMQEMSGGTIWGAAQSLLTGAPPPGQAAGSTSSAPGSQPSSA